MQIKTQGPKTPPFVVELEPDEARRLHAYLGPLPGGDWVIQPLFAGLDDYLIENRLGREVVGSDQRSYARVPSPHRAPGVSMHMEHLDGDDSDDE